MHPYHVYKCELINIAAKRPQDIERAPLEPNTNYMFVSGEWPLSTLDQCGPQKVKAIHFCWKVSAHSTTNQLLAGKDVP